MGEEEEEREREREEEEEEEATFTILGSKNMEDLNFQIPNI